MRMIGIGLMGFLLAGAALLLSTMNILEKGKSYVSHLTNGPQLVFEDRLAAPERDEFTATIYRSNPNHPIILSGLPAYQGVTFALPVDARPTSGYLQIDATSQVLSGVEGVLRISIDNTRRAEMLLRPGEVGQSLQISLLPTDFARDELVVSFSLQGTSHQNLCSSEDSFEAVVEIETTSAVILTLDRPLASPRDQVLAWGQLARVAWPDWLASEERLRRLSLAAQFRQRGIEVLLVEAQAEDALTTVELREAFSHFEQKTIRETPASWPMRLARTGANSGARRFHHSTEWRTRFDLRQGAEMQLPNQLVLDLVFGFLTDINQWSVVTTLNGRLLSQDLLKPSQRNYSQTIALPAEMLSQINVIEVTASATYTRDGVCDKGPELVAEMLPTSMLVQGTETFSDEMSALKTALSNMGTVTFASISKLTAVDARIAVELLAESLPLDVTLKPEKGLPQIVVYSPSDAPVLLPQTQPIWIVYNDSETRKISARSVKGGTQLRETGVALIVIPGGFPLDRTET